MMDEIQQTNDSASVAPGSAPSAPVADTAPTSAALSRSTRGGRTGAKKSAPVSTDEKLTQSMSAIYDSAEARQGGQQPATPDLSPTPDLSADTPEQGTPLPNSINGRTSLDIWNATPKEMQQLILDREREAHEQVTRQGQELAELRKSGGMAGELAEVLQHFEPNLPPHVAQLPRVQQIAALYQASEMLDRDPVGSIQKLAAQYGLDLSQLGSNPAAAAQHEQTLRQYQAAYQQLQSQQQQQQYQRVQYLQREIENYISQKDYWPQVEDEVLTQVNAIREKNPSLFAMDPMAVLKQAEERALSIKGVSTRESAIAARKKADEAKRIASINVRSNVGKSPSSVSKDIWSNDSWDRVYDAVQTRG